MKLVVVYIDNTELKEAEDMIFIKLGLLNIK